MASATPSAANRLSAREGAGPRTARREAAMQRSPVRHPPAELCRAAPHRRRSGFGENTNLAKQTQFIE